MGLQLFHEKRSGCTWSISLTHDLRKHLADLQIYNLVFLRNKEHYTDNSITYRK